MKRIHVFILVGLASIVFMVCIVAAYLALSIFSNQQTVSPPSVRPTITPAPTVTPTILSFTGSGDDFVIFHNDTPGLAMFFLGHRGDGLFAVQLLNSDGLQIGLLAIETGEYDGKTTQRLESGTYTLNITADGPWAIVVGLPE